VTFFPPFFPIVFCFISYPAVNYLPPLLLHLLSLFFCFPFLFLFLCPLLGHLSGSTTWRRHFNKVSPRARSWLLVRRKCATVFFLRWAAHVRTSMEVVRVRRGKEGERPLSLEETKRRGGWLGGSRERHERAGTEHASVAYVCWRCLRCETKRYNCVGARRTHTNCAFGCLAPRRRWEREEGCWSLPWLGGGGHPWVHPSLTKPTHALSGRGCKAPKSLAVFPGPGVKQGIHTGSRLFLLSLKAGRPA
jgi:hypothetical protein